LQLSFVKMQGAGNDYIYFDGVTWDLARLDWGQAAIRWSDRRRGIGSDGIILILPSDRADFRMRMFNSDGTEGKMCGNGIRCLARYVWESGLTRETSLTVETAEGIVYPEIIPGEEGVQVRVRLSPPRFIRKKIPMLGPPDGRTELVHLEVGGRPVPVTAVSVGNPHCVLILRDIERVDISYLGPLFEHHEAFPERTNVEFVQVLDSNHLRAKVWERGSGITHSCGTGAAASVVSARARGLIEGEARVTMPGGELGVTWDDADELWLSGPAEESFRGTLEIANDDPLLRDNQ